MLYSELVLVFVFKVSFDYIRRVVEKELGLPLEEVFAEFSFVPAATASIAQVHFAVLKPHALQLVRHRSKKHAKGNGTNIFKDGARMMDALVGVSRGEGLEVAVKVQLGNKRSIMNDVEALYRTSVLLKRLDLDGGLDSPIICKAYSTTHTLATWTHVPLLQQGTLACVRLLSCQCVCG